MDSATRGRVLDGIREQITKNVSEQFFIYVNIATVTLAAKGDLVVASSKLYLSHQIVTEPY